MKYTMIAPAGDHTDALFVGMREFPTERIVLLHTDKLRKKAEGIQKDLTKFRVPVTLHRVDGENVWEAIFQAVGTIKANLAGKDIIVNVASGDRTMQCAMTSASFVHGVKAFNCMGDHCMLLPVLKFSYYKMISDKKLTILKVLQGKDCCASMEELSKKVKMSLPLISYHINGNLKSEGLKDMGLVETDPLNNRTAVRLSSLGTMLLKGYVEQATV